MKKRTYAALAMALTLLLCICTTCGKRRPDVVASETERMLRNLFAQNRELLQRIADGLLVLEIADGLLVLESDHDYFIEPGQAAHAEISAQLQADIDTYYALKVEGAEVLPFTMEDSRIILYHFIGEARVKFKFPAGLGMGLAYPETPDAIDRRGFNLEGNWRIFQDLPE